MLELAPDRLTLQDMEKKPEESYKEYAMRWKAVASQVPLPLTHREINSYFVDTLPSPYYDMLIGNVFLEFGDLLYAVRRIEYGIKNGRIANTEAKIPKQSIFEQHLSRKRTRENSTRKRKLSRTFLIHHKSCFLHPNNQFRKEIQMSTRIAPRVAKERGPRCSMHSQYLMPNYF